MVDDQTFYRLDALFGHVSLIDFDYVFDEMWTQSSIWSNYFFVLMFDVKVRFGSFGQL